MIWVIGGVLDLWIPLSCACDVCKQSGVAKDERDCDLISSKYDYDNTMNIEAAFREKAQLSQFVPSNFLIMDSSFKVVVSAMIWVCDSEALV